MLIIYCICLFDGCFGSGVWQCWNCRVPFFLLGWRGTPEGGGIGLGGGFVGWIERDARGRWHRSGQGLRRGILLGLRETAKSIAAGPELASGSDSRPCRNNAVSRSPSSNHPSSAAARPDATFLWLTLPTDRKKTCGGWKWTGRPVLKCQTGTEYSYKNRRIQKRDRPSVSP